MEWPAWGIPTSHLFKYSSEVQGDTLRGPLKWLEKNKIFNYSNRNSKNSRFWICDSNVFISNEMKNFFLWLIKNKWIHLKMSPTKNKCFLCSTENLLFIFDKKQMKKISLSWKLFNNTRKHLHLERQTI